MAVKRFIFVRHGHYDKDGLELHERQDAPISDRGWDGAIEAGEVLAGLGMVPDLVVTTLARRTQETAEVLSMAGEWTAPTKRVQGGFASGKSTLEDKLRDWVKNGAETVLFVGHCKQQEYLKTNEQFPKDINVKARAGVFVYERNIMGGWDLVAYHPGLV